MSTGTPKPAPRIVDEALLARFRRAHPYCALAGCYASAVPHHIVKRSQGGGDVWDNLVALCVRHHTGDEGWHNGLKFPTPQAWLVVYGDQLPDAVYANIARALGVEAA